MASKHGGGGHELGCHRMQFRVVAAHGGGEGVHAPAPHHTHTTPVPTEATIDPRWEKPSNGRAFFL